MLLGYIEDNTITHIRKEVDVDIITTLKRKKWKEFVEVPVAIDPETERRGGHQDTIVDGVPTRTYLKKLRTAEERNMEPKLKLQHIDNKSVRAIRELLVASFPNSTAVKDYLKPLDDEAVVERAKLVVEAK